MRIICDGHEYRVIEKYDITQRGLRKNWIAKDNYGNLVAIASESECGEYWHFEHGSEELSDMYHESDLEGFTIPEQLVRWYSVLGI